MPFLNTKVPGTNRVVVIHSAQHTPHATDHMVTWYLDFDVQTFLNPLTSVLNQF